MSENRSIQISLPSIGRGVASLSRLDFGGGLLKPKVAAFEQASLRDILLLMHWRPPAAQLGCI